MSHYYFVFSDSNMVAFNLQTMHCVIFVAEVDEDDEEDDELDWEEGAAELIERKSTYEGPTAKELESNRRLNELMK